MYTYKVNPRLKIVIENVLISLKGLSVPVSEDILFKESGGITRYGYCTKSRAKGISGTDFTISINKYFLHEEDELATVVHELLHTVEGCFNHSRLWKTYADKCSLYFGVKIMVRSDYELSKEAVNKSIKICPEYYFDPEFMNMAECPSCGKRFCVSKKVRPGRNGRYRYMCSKCHKSLIILNI